MAGASSSLSVVSVHHRRREQRLLLVLCGLISLLVHLLLIVSEQKQGEGQGPVIRSRIQGSAERIELVRQARPSSPSPPEAQADPIPPLQEAKGEEATAKAIESEGEGTREGYLPAEKLSTRPQFPPDMQALLAAVLEDSDEGRVVVTMLIAADGTPDRVELEYSELGFGASQRFVERLESLKLSPGLLEGQPVKTRWRLEFSFTAVE